MKYEICPISPEYEKDWEDFVNNHKDSTIFHSLGWKKVMEQTFGFKPEYLVVKDSDNKLVGVSPAFYVKTFFGKVIISQPFFEYGGPIVDIGFEEAYLDIFNFYKNKCLKERLNYIELKALPNDDNPFFDKVGYIKHFKAYDYFIDIKGKNFEKDIWLGLYDNKVRNSIRKGIKSKVRIVQEENITVYYGLYLKTMMKLGSPPYPKNLFENIKEYVGGRIRFTFAYIEEIPIAAMFSFIYNGRISIVGNVSDSDYKNINANDLLYNEQIENAIKNKFNIIDFGRTRPNSDYERYKRKWGATRKEMFSYIYPPSSGKNANPYKYYDLFSRFTKKMPWILTKFGPYVSGKFP